MPNEPASDPKNCFVIAPIGDEGSETRKRSDQILKYVISPALEATSFRAVRADQMSEPGLITTQIIQHIVDDPLVVADLSGRNPNVFYELAIRHAIRKPFVQLIDSQEQIPFDVAGTRTIQIDHKDLDSVENARDEIVRQITSLKDKSSDLETPISVSLDLQQLRQSDDPERRSFAEVLESLTGLHRTLNSVESQLQSHSIPRRLIDIVEELTGYARRASVLTEDIAHWEEMEKYAGKKTEIHHLNDLRQAVLMVRRLSDQLLEAAHN